MVYAQPQVTLRQIFNPAVTAVQRRQLAVIVGGHAQLFRYSEADEKALALLGAYDHVGTNIDGVWQTQYDWPNKPVGSKVDLSFTSVIVENALLRYYNVTDDSLVRVGRNMIRDPNTVFATANNVNHSASLLDRGAKVGDVVVVRGQDAANNVYNLVTYIKGFKGDPVAAVVAAATKNTLNQATVTLTSSHSADSANSGDMVISVVDASSYSGYVYGAVQETYTVEVILAGTGSDLTTARFRVTSASGTDDAVNVATNGAGLLVLGSHGATVDFNVGDGVNFILGDKWTITVREAFTAPTPTSGGTYTGTVDTEYIAEVVTGGNSSFASYTDDPYLLVYTTDGSDSAPAKVLSGPAGTAFAVGTRGVTLSFDQTKLRLGDKYHVQVTAAKEGAQRTLLLGHDLDSAIPTESTWTGTTTAATAELEVQIFIKKASLTLAEKSPLVPGDYQWTQSQTKLSLLADAHHAEESWTDDDVIVPLPLIKDALTAANYNQAYANYRVWLPTLTTAVYSISGPGDLDTLIAGKTTTNNPLKQGVSYALQNAGGQVVRFIAVADPDDVASWRTALSLVERQTEAYGLVPLTKSKNVLDEFQTHVNAMSADTVKRFRRAWFSSPRILSKALVNSSLSSNELVVQATTADDGDTSGTQHTILTITSGNADLVDAGVAAGDVVRYKYSTDAWGVESYSTFTVDAVLNSNTLRLVTGTTGAENVPIKVEIHRNLNAEQEAAELALEPGKWNDYRISLVFPDEFEDGGDQPGFFLCAALAGLTSNLSPNQGITNVEVKGVSTLLRVTERFTDEQLNRMAESGMHIVTKDPETGDVYSRHAVTTDDYEVIAKREEMSIRNGDYISGRIVDQFSPYIGRSNAVVEMLDIIRAELAAVRQELQRPISPTLGPILIDLTITALRISPVFKDQIVLEATCDRPYPLNNLNITLLLL